MLISTNVHEKSREVSIKTKSPPASYSFKGVATKHTTVKWSIPWQWIENYLAHLFLMGSLHQLYLQLPKLPEKLKKQRKLEWRNVCLVQKHPHLYVITSLNFQSIYFFSKSCYSFVALISKLQFHGMFTLIGSTIWQEPNWRRHGQNTSRVL